MTQAIGQPTVVRRKRTKKMDARTFVFKVLMYAFLTMTATIVLIPMISLFTVSLQPADASTTSLSWPTNPDWENYVIAWTK